MPAVAQRGSSICECHAQPLSAGVPPNGCGHGCDHAITGVIIRVHSRPELLTPMVILALSVARNGHTQFRARPCRTRKPRPQHWALEMPGTCEHCDARILVHVCTLRMWWCVGRRTR